MWITIDDNGVLTVHTTPNDVAFRQLMQGHQAFRIEQRGNTWVMTPVRAKPETVQMEEVFVTADLEDDNEQNKPSDS